MLKWLLKRQYFAMGWAKAQTSETHTQMWIGESDEHNDSTIVEWFKRQIAIYHNITELNEIEYISITKCWVVFNHFEIGTHDVFTYDDDEKENEGE